MMQTSEYMLTEGNVKRQIIRFAVPLFIGHLFQQLYNTVDSLIVGNLLGTHALAAVTSTGSLIYLAVGFFMGFSMGAGVVTARNLGAGNREEVSRSVHTTIAIGIVTSIVMTVLGVRFSRTILVWMQCPEDVIDLAAAYLRVYFAGSTGLVFYNILVGILQASGDSKHPLYYLIFSSILNAVLDYCFIRFFRMQVEGAALATILAQFISALLVLRRLTHTEEAIRIDWRKIRFHKIPLGQIVYIGLPTALQACVIDLANMMIQSYINTFQAEAMAGFGVSTRLEGFLFLPVTAFSMALSTFVSQNLGAQKKDRVREGVTFGLLSCVLVIQALGILIFFFCPQLIALFDTNPEVIRYGMMRSRICSLLIFLCGFSHASSAVMRGIGRPVVPTVVMLVCWCAVRVVTLLTIGKVCHDMRLVIWLYPVTWFLSTVVYLFYLRRLRKKEVI